MSWEPSARFARLPKWAQVEMEAMNRRIETLEARIAEIPESENTAVWDDPYGYMGGRRAVADAGSYLRFELGDRRWVDVRVAHDRSCIELMGDSRLSIRLAASNMCSVVTS